MDSCSVKKFEKEGIPVITVEGYFESQAGIQIDNLVTQSLKNGGKFIILDLSACDVVNSPGVSALLETTLKVIEDFKGKLLLCGLSALHKSVFTMAGLINIAEVSAHLEEAIKKCKNFTARQS